MFAPQFLRVGLPFFTFILLGTYGLSQGLKRKNQETDRRKRYVEPEDPETVLKKLKAATLQEDVKMVAVPGKGQGPDQGSREFLERQLQSLRESEKWTGIKLDPQKAEVKKKLKALPKAS
mmetsp:Transcript_16656/g.25873  ORF Transcript_16656/g.25873 Transcript_16656/m.25873 type:complete len:120 (+) Transcript_16656:311-670(+)|eukprot:CAMPEP_0184309198 /NCGR_PEP_ID=MMETSP1049-20130417/17441_1 /TAXON_ID=77928 /ORGANISM="Proteomonas sulcata, Strain CCMP704" /LENGTH=119 /DNA_ID=CAMNT_0026622047 /DNA_START=305 /DNA_END=664 /DNA_ORIENTATION=+